MAMQHIQALILNECFFRNWDLYDFASMAKIPFPLLDRMMNNNGKGVVVNDIIFYKIARIINISAKTIKIMYNAPNINNLEELQKLEEKKNPVEKLQDIVNDMKTEEDFILKGLCEELNDIKEEMDEKTVIINDENDDDWEDLF